MLKVCLDRKIARELRILRFDGKKIPKEEMAKIEKEGKIDAAQKEVYEAFIKFENMILLKSWTTALVRENFERLALLHDPSHVASPVPAAAMAQKALEDKEGAVKYIGSWLGAAAIDPASISQVVAAPGGDNGSDEDEFFDALEEQTEMIETMSEQIYKLNAEAAEAQEE